MKLISIVCQKGGVGKTTIVVNLSSMFAKKGYKTLLIDLDPQGNVSTYLNFDKNREDITNSMKLFEGITKINPGYIDENYYLIPSNIKIAKHNEEKIVVGSKLKKLKEKGVFEEYDLVFVDTPPTMSSLVQEAIVFSDFYLIPTKAEFLAIEGVGQAMEFATNTLKSTPNSNPELLGVLLNQTLKETESNKEFVNELNEILGEKLLKTKIPLKREIAESPLYEKTVIDFNEEGEPYKAFNSLAQEIKERIGLNEKTT